MSIGNFNSSLLPQYPSQLRPPLPRSSQQTLDDAKQKLAEVLGSVTPESIKLGNANCPERNHDVIGVEKPIEQLIQWVDDKQHVAQNTTFDVLSGKSDNLHQSILATQEAGLAFTLLLEVRNKLVEGFRELTRMSI